MQRRAPSLLLFVSLSFVSLSAIATFAADVIVFGPQTYTRATGQPVTVKKTFRIRVPSATYILRVVNHGVSSAVISLNGRTVFGPSDFTNRENEDGALLEQPVTVSAADNEIAVELRSKPGASLTVEISSPNLDTTPPSVTAKIDPPNPLINYVNCYVVSEGGTNEK